MYTLLNLTSLFYASEAQLQKIKEDLLKS